MTRLIELCGDDLRVTRHERLTPLRPDDAAFTFPDDVRRGDALIVFSRRGVHATARSVARRGMRPSLIYGALPYSVRHEEARRFNAGETDVVVATDAIGMGMNLPIARIVFVDQKKFDGHARRMLTAEEVQQIAGRAGRYGRYDQGLYQSADEGDTIRRLYAQRVDDIVSIPVGLPDDIALVRDATLTESIVQWMSLEQPPPFERVDVSRELRLINQIETKLADDERRDIGAKQRTLSLATMAFDDTDKHLYHLWRQMVDAELTGTTPELHVPDAPAAKDGMAELEDSYRQCDLLYSYARTFDHREDIDGLVARRDEIAHAIMGRLARFGGRGRIDHTA